MRRTPEGAGQNAQVVTDLGEERRCLVLGAGFSRAVSPLMPTTDELGDLAAQALTHAGIPPPPQGFTGGYFEAWLSRLAEPQPDLRGEENMHNQATFISLTRILREVLVRRQNEVMDSPPPWWLQRLIGVAHQARLTVIRFNYDTLLEAACNACLVWDWANRNRVFSTHLVQDLPPVPVVARAYGTLPADTFRLLKLHGSVDCWWVNDDATGATIVRSPGGPWRQPGPGDHARAGALPGRTPFVVPPAAAKSHFYRNPVTRELWQQAAAALQAADSVALIGYSLPVTDLVTSGMFADRLSGRDVTVEVVNPYPEPPVEALKRLSIPAQAYDGLVESYVDTLEQQAATAATAELADLPGQLPVLVGSAETQVAAVTGLKRNGQTTYLVVESFTGSREAARHREASEAPPLTIADLHRELGTQRDASAGLAVRLPDGNNARVIGWKRLLVPFGQASGPWRCCVPAPGSRRLPDVHHQQ